MLGIHSAIAIELIIFCAHVQNYMGILHVIKLFKVSILGHKYISECVTECLAGVVCRLYTKDERHEILWFD